MGYIEIPEFEVLDFCGRCDGFGQIYYGKPAEPTVFANLECGPCKGTGKVPTEAGEKILALLEWKADAA